MINKELKVTVNVAYHEVITTTDPILCARVLALLAESSVQNPETAEQKLVRELQDRVAEGEGRRYDEKARADRLEKQLAELTARVTRAPQEVAS